MKTRCLFFSLLLASTAVVAADPQKLVPRPIPGMAAAAPVKAAAPLIKPVSSQQAAAAGANPDRARVLYIHRRATLPAEITKSLPAATAEAAAPSAMVNVRQGAVKIIPKSEVAQILKTRP
ncbi:hypothetical protein [Prosthecobacter fluviatilis]|uniref:Uncharacterized protein n=1 Tax=Prosthecobacter fluviatilis TaxID=445931 RepID=A0ABW0KNC9_9BACT